MFIAMLNFHRNHKLRKTFSKFYRRHYELISKFNVGLKTLKLSEGLSEPEFYGDLVYKFKKLTCLCDVKNCSFSCLVLFLALGSVKF